MTLDPVTLSVLANALAGVADEMGAVLVRGAYSANIKERRDCSTALFDAGGRMVAQAEHIPVHLGAMTGSVDAVLARAPEPGDVFMLNDPFQGGSHLPDVTLVSTVTLGDAVVGYAVVRAHYAEIGGAQPGSMTADSRDIYQEGIILPPVRLVRTGELVTDVLDIFLANVRTPDVARGDLRAQLAAVRLAQSRLAELADRFGTDLLLAGFDGVMSYAERRTREAIRALPAGTYTARGELEGDGHTDDDVPIQVAVTVADSTVTVDFAGTAAAVTGNVNCPLSVTRSACLFALRVALRLDAPANAGSAAPLVVLAPEGSLVNAVRPAAVVAGNVETSQRVADTVLAALSQATEVPAPGQGTMNNLVLAGDGWAYYETIAGGQGAAAGAPGDSGVHVGMTNTLNTPIEALELEYPMRVERYELRYGTGGAGRWPGGDGVVRAVRMLAPGSGSLITDRRRHAPPGIDGGGPGAVGENLLNDEPLPPKAGFTVESGDVVTVRTPGGGGAGIADGEEPR